MAKPKKKKQSALKRLVSLNPKGLLKGAKTHNQHLEEAFNYGRPKAKKKKK